MSITKISYVNLAKQWEDEKTNLLPLIDDALSSGQYIGGNVVEKFEEKVSSICQTKYCIALNSGTDALIYGLLALGVKPGDEVITPPNSFIASTAAIVHVGAKPVFVDVLSDQNINPNLIEKAITSKTKAIMPVHLTGRMCQMDSINHISEKYSIPIIEDSAQSIGSKYKGIPSGKWGKVGCFSAHPLKNLNACGDAGFLVTDDSLIYDQIKLIRNHGLIDRNTAMMFGYVSRMDAIQAVILNYRLLALDDVNEKRRGNAKFYFDNLNRDKIFIPEEGLDHFSTYHTFVIQVDKRDELQKYLAEHGIETSIHYPIPIHLQPAAKNLGYHKNDFPMTENQAKRIITLPVNQYLKRKEIEFIVEKINLFFST
jgi:dTDP-4-amino-4,6-dideoxygalactose transaminase